MEYFLNILGKTTSPSHFLWPRFLIQFSETKYQPCCYYTPPLLTNKHGRICRINVVKKPLHVRTSTEIRITLMPFFDFMSYNCFFIIGRHTAKMGSDSMPCCCRVSLWPKRWPLYKMNSDQWFKVILSDKLKVVWHIFKGYRNWTTAHKSQDICWKT